VGDDGSARSAWSVYEDLDPAAPGAIVAVVQSGAVAGWRSFGAESPGGPPLTPATPFYVASVAKQFTAACVASLVLDGVVEGSDEVRRWLPEAPHSWTGMRLSHLLAHTSGLPSANEADASWKFGVDMPFTTADRVRRIITLAPEHEPGTVHRYDNHGYVLLAEIVERASGLAFGRFATHRLFEPLGMTTSSFLDIAARPDVVTGWRNGREPVRVAFTCVGDGGLVTSIEDLARWDGWLPTSPLAPLLIGPRSVLADGTAAHDAWGISCRVHDGHRVESHGGAIDGYLAKFVRYPDLGRTVIALANSDADGVTTYSARMDRFVDRAASTMWTSAT
jgi:CubicO group peptidase (beta-lactamase class C family)